MSPAIIELRVLLPSLRQLLPKLFLLHPEFGNFFPPRRIFRLLRAVRLRKLLPQNLLSLRDEGQLFTQAAVPFRELAAQRSNFSFQCRMQFCDRPFHRFSFPRLVRQFMRYESLSVYYRS
jgi:hypothetical protein